MQKRCIIMILRLFTLTRTPWHSYTRMKRQYLTGGGGGVVSIGYFRLTVLCFRFLQCECLPRERSRNVYGSCVIFFFSVGTRDASGGGPAAANSSNTYYTHVFRGRKVGKTNITTSIHSIIGFLHVHV